MIVVMAGLPGTGKSTLARKLAVRLGGVVVSKDEIREAAFGEFVDYSSGQDDLCMEFVYQVARYVKAPVVIDGRTYTKKRQVDRLVEVLGEVRMIECVCDEAIVKDRLERDRAHVARNRDYAMYVEMKKTAEKIEMPRLTVDTQNADALSLAVEYILGPRMDTDGQR